MIVKSWPFVTQDITSESAPKMFNSTDCFQPSNAFLFPSILLYMLLVRVRFRIKVNILNIVDNNKNARTISPVD